MALVQISRAQGRIPITVFQLQDRINLGNYQELEQTAKEAYDAGTVSYTHLTLPTIYSV